ncbi:MAG: hypothetical protein IKA12_03505 [Clostridia bacterium]|nr:hypothetical protein [Clostridia bacterium]
MFKRLGALVLVISLIVGSILLKTPAKQAVCADNSTFGGYYETHTKEGVLDLPSTVSAVSSAVITGENKIGGTLSENVSVTVNSTKATIGEIPQTLNDSMVLGNYYTLTLNGNVSVEFRFVTKTISTKDDLSILKLTSKTKAITGYYVLLNDLKLEKGEENYHDVNGESSGHGISWNTYGFRGTFDGQGHNIEFWANSTGFFGALGIDGCIKNTGFVNVQVYTPGENPVLFHSATYLYENDRALIENVYIRMADKNVPEGAICMSGSIPLMIHNVVIEFPGANIDHSTGDTSVGALWGADYGWWVANGTEMKDIPDPLSYKDVYIIGRMPVSHYRYIHPDNTTGKKGFYTKEDGTLGRGWMEGYAENEGVTEDIFNGEKVYKGVRKYNTLALLAEDDTNDYSSFNTEYWAVSEYGIPVWKNGVEENFDVFLETLGQKTSAAFYLERGGIERATIGFGLGGISVPSVPLTFEFIKGQEFISIDSSTGVVSAVADGMAQFFVRCSYNGKDYEKKYTVYVTTKEGYTPEEPDNPTGGCGTFIIDGGSIGGGLLMILSAVAFVVLKKKKSLA